MIVWWSLMKFCKFEMVKFGKFGLIFEMRMEEMDHNMNYPK